MYDLCKDLIPSEKYFHFQVVSIKQNEGNLQYKFALPGVKKEDVTITITNNKLSVETNQNTVWGEKFKYIDQYNYDATYKVDETSAKLEDGVLTITIPQKKTKEQVKQITIQ